ncbi:hypothetical protein A1Q1_07565 [Trichosporon asahii var. asahii CBS 2479]|uniref:Uncharacterized protein n=1 Tax=Trichosporon asahii var. asahii (strain ATCC 90039 / CBS 2479 / JCM 2466 / KCTC 7840 / NBRC 103889/ NCYC 2677 / UAMH 7654) TaxID=1186058 RepID=J5R8D2_TRIAS|nr:hypothetical protein A1Q1_07565 [Trichosporon asahii var. asahii CBS 2479]EJT51238.1 hypothetical protein A1Q1_07565 [Trichosporon asahii var. asahii CBS 2479]
MFAVLIPTALAILPLARAEWEWTAGQTAWVVVVSVIGSFIILSIIGTCIRSAYLANKMAEQFQQYRPPPPLQQNVYSRRERKEERDNGEPKADGIPRLIRTIRTQRSHTLPSRPPPTLHPRRQLPGYQARPDRQSTLQSSFVHRRVCVERPIVLVALYSIVHASLSNADVCLVATDFSLKIQGTGLFSSFPSQRPLSMVAILNSSAPAPPDIAEGIQTLGFLAHGALFVLEVIVNLTPLALLAALVVCIIGVSPPSTGPTSSTVAQEAAKDGGAKDGQTSTLPEKSSQTATTLLKRRLVF